MRFSDQIERRMKLHDLHVLTTVTQFGSMAAAARQLNTSQPRFPDRLQSLRKPWAFVYSIATAVVLNQLITAAHCSTAAWLYSMNSGKASKELSF
jgi:Bacterial regulatory helix-turn-helix protein, lysR family